ncbi:MAG TPA: methyltransferase domain-containing protein [Rhodopila sp.]|nr:methyltransferase domain-containing protein [Rhodopila sp.]
MLTTTLAPPIEPPLEAHRYLDHHVLAPFAQELARRLSRLNTGPLLEIAAGTGTLTRAMVAAVSAAMVIVATDPDPSVVAGHTAMGAQSRITWHAACPWALPFPDDAFGIIACQFAVAAMPRRTEVLREARRVMMPGGRFVFSLPGPLRGNPAAQCIQDALDTLFPNDPPGFLRHGLHGYADDDLIDHDLTEAGFTDAMYANVGLPFTGTAEDAARAYCLGTPLRDEILQRNPDALPDVTAAVARTLQSRLGGGTLRAGMRALIVSASA